MCMNIYSENKIKSIMKLYRRLEFLMIKIKVLGSGVIAPRIFNLDATWRWVVSFTPRPLYSQRKNPWYPLDRRLGELQSRPGRCGEEKNFQPLPGIEHGSSSPSTSRYTNYAIPGSWMLKEVVYIVTTTLWKGTVMGTVQTHSTCTTACKFGGNCVFFCDQLA
jgi:hypothetical protein